MIYFIRGSWAGQYRETWVWYFLWFAYHRVYIQTATLENQAISGTTPIRNRLILAERGVHATPTREGVPLGEYRAE